MTIKSLPSGSVFLEGIPDIVILTAKTRLSGTIKVGDTPTYEELLYPAGGEVCVADLAEIFRPLARQKLCVNASITITEQSVVGETETNEETKTVNLTVNYSTVDIVGVNCTEFLQNHFLTLLEGRKTTAIGRLEYLHYMGTEEATITAHYSGTTSTKEFTGTAVGGNDIYTTLDVSPAAAAD